VYYISVCPYHSSVCQNHTLLRNHTRACIQINERVLAKKYLKIYTHACELHTQTSNFHKFVCRFLWTCVFVGFWMSIQHAIFCCVPSIFVDHVIFHDKNFSFWITAYWTLKKKSVGLLRSKWLFFFGFKIFKLSNLPSIGWIWFWLSNLVFFTHF
jgi:hypothetical protein